MRTTIGTIEPLTSRMAAQVDTEIRLLEIKLTELERRLKREQGPAAVAQYRDAVAAAVEREFKPDTGNVVRLRRN